MLSVCYDTFWSDFSGTFLPNAVLFMLHAIQQVQNLTMDNQRTCMIDNLVGTLLSAMCQIGVPLLYCKLTYLYTEN